MKRKFFGFFVILFGLMVLAGCSPATHGKVNVVDLTDSVREETILEAGNAIVSENLTVVFSNDDIAVRHFAQDGGWVFLVTPAEILVINDVKGDEACRKMFEAVVGPTSGMSNDQAVMELVIAAEKEIKHQQSEMIMMMVFFGIAAFMIGAALASGADVFSGGGGNTFVYINRGSSSRSSFSSSGGSFRGHR